MNSGYFAVLTGTRGHQLRIVDQYSWRRQDGVDCRSIGVCFAP
jgi:hypothetical protein